ncbi:hypothetical protein HDU83_008179, partial [Entophlyctis luteolus]
MRQKLWNGLPALNFIIGSSALSFQVFVLYPWHLQLDRDFENMKTDIQREYLRELDLIKASIQASGQKRAA